MKIKWYPRKDLQDIERVIIIKYPNLTDSKTGKSVVLKTTESLANELPLESKVVWTEYTDEKFEFLGKPTWSIRAKNFLREWPYTLVRNSNDCLRNP